eukprot:scaffold31270_cov112-Isochrysis_galbana.AAC.3
MRRRRAEQWLSQSMRPSPRLGARLLLVGALGVVYRVFVDPWFGCGGGALSRWVEVGLSETNPGCCVERCSARSPVPISPCNVQAA